MKFKSLTRRVVCSKCFLVIFTVFLLRLVTPDSVFAQSADTVAYTKLLSQIKNRELPFDTALLKLKTAIAQLKEQHEQILLARMYMAKGSLFYKRKNDFNNALINYRWAYAILKKTESPYYFDVVESISDVFYYLDQPDSIYAYAQEGLEHAKMADNKLGEGKMLNQIGLYYEYKSEWGKALQNYLNALKIFESLGQKRLMASTWVNIGNLYLNRGDEQSAKTYFFKVLNYGKKTKNDDLISIAVNNLGTVYSSEKKYDSALIYFKRSLEYDIKKGGEFDVAVSLLNIASAQANLKHFDSARYLFRKVIQISQKNKYAKPLVYSYNNLANLYGDTTAPYYNVDSAIFYYSKLLQLSEQSGGLEDLAAAYYGLQLLYGKKGDYAKAFDFADKYIEVSDSLFNIKKIKQLNEIKAKYELEKKEKEYLLLQQKNQRVKLNFILTLALSIFSIVVLSILLRIRLVKNRQLREQKKFVDNLLQYDNSYIIILSRNDTPLFLSPSVKRDFSVSQNSDIIHLIHPEDKEKILSIINNIKADVLVRAPFSCRVVDKEGAVKYVTGLMSNKLADPMLKGVLINFWDYTLQKQYERQLEESEKKYRSIFEAFPDVFFRVSADKVILELSPSVEKITGMKREELIGKKINEIFPHIDDWDYADRAFRIKGEINDYTVTVRNVNGKNIVGSVTAKMLTDEEGNPIGAEGVFRDITERVKQENELREANETKDKLFSIIAHDLVGPIGMQKNILDLMLSDIDAMSKEEIISFLESIKPSLDATFFMIENLLSWARIMRNTIQPNIKKGKIYKVIQQSFDFLESQAKNKEIRLEYKGDKELTARFDMNILDIVIRNLITNAIKFSPKGERVTVEVKKAEGKVRVSVIDRGVGMPEEIIRELKKEKHKIKSRTGTSKEKGTGLGLVVVKEFLSYLGSKLYIESEENKGSVFFFDLPVE